MPRGRRSPISGARPDARTAQALVALILLDRRFEHMSESEKRAAIKRITTSADRLSNKNRGGRPLGTDKWREADFWLLYEIDRRYETADRQGTVFQAIHQAVQEKWKAGIRPGANTDAIARRLFARLRPTVHRAGKMKAIMSTGEFDHFAIAKRVRPLIRRLPPAS
jgi:hypothetical protein